MNIVIVKPAGDYYFRADSTLNHKFLDYYCPEAVASLQVTPVLYTRISKTAKCVAERFAKRYFDSFAFGCLIDDATAGITPAMAVSLDGTCVMGMDFRPVDDLPRGSFSLRSGGHVLFQTDKAPDASRFASSIVAVSSRSMMRLGDILALELTPASPIERGETVTLCNCGIEHSFKIF